MLSVTTINKSFGGVQALRGASMDCAAAEIVGLIGPNGAGKSTLVNVISGILAPDRGRVEIGRRCRARAINSAQDAALRARFRTSGCFAI